MFRKLCILLIACTFAPHFACAFASGNDRSPRTSEAVRAFFHNALVNDMRAPARHERREAAADRPSAEAFVREAEENQSARVDGDTRTQSRTAGAVHQAPPLATTATTTEAEAENRIRRVGDGDLPKTLKYVAATRVQSQAPPLAQPRATMTGPGAAETKVETTTEPDAISGDVRFALAPADMPMWYCRTTPSRAVYFGEPVGPEPDIYAHTRPLIADPARIALFFLSDDPRTVLPHDAVFGNDTDLDDETEWVTNGVIYTAERVKHFFGIPVNHAGRSRRMMLDVTFLNVGPRALANDPGTLASVMGALGARILAGEFGRPHLLWMALHPSRDLALAVAKSCDASRQCLAMHVLDTTEPRTESHAESRAESIFRCNDPLPVDCVARNRTSGARRFDMLFSAVSRTPWRSSLDGPEYRADSTNFEPFPVTYPSASPSVYARELAQRFGEGTPSKSVEMSVVGSTAVMLLVKAIETTSVKSTTDSGVAADARPDLAERLAQVLSVDFSTENRQSPMRPSVAGRLMVDEFGRFDNGEPRSRSNDSKDEARRTRKPRAHAFLRRLFGCSSGRRCY